LTGDEFVDDMQAIIGQELRARYETPQEVPPEMLRLLAHLDEQAGKEWQALNEKQEPRTGWLGM
jgi:hypothetical protein